MQASVEPDYSDQMKEFPCCFNLACDKKITLNRLKAVEYKLITDLKHEDCESEVMMQKNLLSWIYFRLARRDESAELSDDIVKLTQWNNLASLANRCFIMWKTGDELEAKKCLECLKKIKSEERFRSLLTEAKAEQAYYYSKLGGFENLKLAIDLFSEVVSEVPNNYLWKFGLGLVYRRSTHGNIFCSSPKPWDLDKCTKQAIQCFFEVADNGDSRLKSLAYAQLLNLRSVHKFYKYNELFHQLSVKDFINKALEQGESVPQVLTQCGKALRWIDVDESIRLLEVSIQIRPISMSYHYLGRSYKRKAQRQAQSTEGNGTEGNSCCLSRDVQSREVSGARRQLFPHNRDSEQGSTSINFKLASEQSFQSTDMRLTSEQDYQNQACTFSKRTEVHEIDISDKSLLQLLQRSNSALMPVHSAHQTRSACFKQSYESPFYLEQPWVQPSAGSPFSQDYCYAGQYIQTLPHGEQKQFDHWENRGRGNSYWRQNNFDRSLSSPQSNHETNSHYQIQGHRSGRSHVNRGRGHNYRPQNNFDRTLSSPQSNHETNSRYQIQGHNSGRSHENNCISPSENGIRVCLPKPRNEIYLNKDDKCVKKALESFKKAIELTQENFPAILDLGILLKETGEILEALIQFNKLTNSKLALKDSQLTIISAYEQAGLCYLKLSETEPPDIRNEEVGKRKLTQAVSCAADLVLIMPELQESAQNLWSAFETLMNKIDEEVSSPNQLKKKVKLLELMNDHRQIVEVFQKMKTFMGDEHFDKEILVSTIKSYLSLGQPENALALQNIIAIRPDVRESDWWNVDPMRGLRINVLLQAISERLSGATDNPTTLFQQAFKMYFGTCIGMHDHDEYTPEKDIVGDVLIVFDDDGDDDDSPGSTNASSRCLKQVATSLFGLEAEENLKGNFEFDCFQHEKQLEEMRKYQVVIIVLGNETRDPKFDAVLKCVVYNKETIEPTNQRILVLDAGLKDGQVPLCLAQYECFKLQDIGGLGNLGQSLENRYGRNGDQISYMDILTLGFHGDVNALLKFFCFVIGQNWPCP